MAAAVTLRSNPDTTRAWQARSAGLTRKAPIRPGKDYTGLRRAIMMVMGVMVGLGFEAKMAVALMVVPGMVAAWLGVLHLDRCFWQNAFTEDDLHLADALAAHVSAAIESAQLLRRQKEQFFKTVMVLAQAVELRASRSRLLLPATTKPNR